MRATREQRSEPGRNRVGPSRTRFSLHADACELTIPGRSIGCSRQPTVLEGPTRQRPPRTGKQCATSLPGRCRVPALRGVGCREHAPRHSASASSPAAKPHSLRCLRSPSAHGRPERFLRSPSAHGRPERFLRTGTRRRPCGQATIADDSAPQGVVSRPTPGRGRLAGLRGLRRRRTGGPGCRRCRGGRGSQWGPMRGS